VRRDPDDARHGRKGHLLGQQKHQRLEQQREARQLAFNPAKSRAAFQYLLTDHQFNIEDKSISGYTHVERRINENSALSAGAQVQIVFDPSYQDLAIHQIDILREGRRINKLDAKRVQLLQRETQLEERAYDGRVTASIVLDDLRVGDQVEYAYTLRGANPVFEGKFVQIDSAGSAVGPVELYSLRLLAPLRRDIRYQMPVGMQVASQVVDGKRETIFRQLHIPQQQFEDGAPALATACGR
jgi:hypothetical protein